MTNMLCQGREFFKITLSFCTSVSQKLNFVWAKRLSIFICVLLTTMWVVQPIVEYAYCGYTMIIGILLVSILSCRNTPSSNDINFAFVCFLLLMGLVFFLSSIIFHEGNKFIFAFVYGAFLPIVNAFLSNADNLKRFAYCFSVAGQISFFFIFVVSAMFAPIRDEQYSSITLNPNYFAVVLIPIILGGIWLVEYGISNGKHKLLTVFFIATELVFMLMTRSRTGMLCVIIFVLIWAIKLLAERKVKELVKLILVLTVLCVLVMQFIAFLFPVSMLTSMKIENELFGKSVVFTTTEMIVVEAIDDEGIADNSSKPSNIVDGAIERAQKGSQAGEDVSSGRFSIWKACIDNLNLKGHASYDTFDVEARELQTNDPHNMILSIGFQTGILGGGVYILFTLYCAYVFLYKLKSLLTERVMSSTDFFGLLIYSSFFVVAMLSSTYTPLGSMLGFAFWCFLSIKRGK